MYKLNESKAKIVHISNDAFMYFAYEEEPLDDTHDFEIAGILASYKYGFELDTESAVPSNDENGLVAVILTPYELVPPKPTLRADLGNNIILNVNYTKPKVVTYWWTLNGKHTPPKETKLKVSDRGTLFFLTETNKKIFLKGLEPIN